MGVFLYICEWAEPRLRRGCGWGRCGGGACGCGGGVLGVCEQRRRRRDCVWAGRECGRLSVELAREA